MCAAKLHTSDPKSGKPLPWTHVLDFDTPPTQKAGSPIPCSRVRSFGTLPTQKAGSSHPWPRVCGFDTLPTQKAGSSHPWPRVRGFDTPSTQRAGSPFLGRTCSILTHLRPKEREAPPLPRVYVVLTHSRPKKRGVPTPGRVCVVLTHLRPKERETPNPWSCACNLTQFRPKERVRRSTQRSEDRLEPLPRSSCSSHEVRFRTGLADRETEPGGPAFSPSLRGGARKGDQGQPEKCREDCIATGSPDVCSADRVVAPADRFTRRKRQTSSCSAEREAAVPSHASSASPDA